MRAAALFSLIVVGTLAHFEIYQIPSQLLTTGNNDAQPCVHQSLAHCQHMFNVALNLSSDLDWTNPNIMGSELSAFYIKGVNGFIQMCSARQQFQACLGNMYSTCMSVPRFVSDGEDLNSASTYVQMFNELEFDCNGGFVQLTENYECVLNVWSVSSDDLNNCVAQFNQTMAQNPNNYCSASAAAEKCTRAPFQAACGAEASWWQCERTRIGGGLDQLCPTNYCTVQQSSRSSLYQAARSQSLGEIITGSDLRNKVMKKLAEKALRRERK